MALLPVVKFLFANLILGPVFAPGMPAAFTVKTAARDRSTSLPTLQLMTFY
jgi:hypothetical protein